MAPVYIAILVFVVFSLLFPLSLILFSKLVRRRNEPNAASTLNFESSEESIGNRLAIMKEYFHYFSSFLAFEVIAAVLLVWVAVARYVPGKVDAAVLIFALGGLVFEAFSILLSRGES